MSVHIIIKKTDYCNSDQVEFSHEISYILLVHDNYYYSFVIFEAMSIIFVLFHSMKYSLIFGCQAIGFYINRVLLTKKLELLHITLLVLLTDCFYSGSFDAKQLLYLKGLYFTFRFIFRSQAFKGHFIREYMLENSVTIRKSEVGLLLFNSYWHKPDIESS